MDNIPEIEQPKAEREVQFSESFNPFEPKYVITHKSSNTPDDFESSIVLDIKGIAKIPFKVLASVSLPYFFKTPYFALTPFNPEINYTIDPNDYSPEKRLQKLKSIQKAQENLSEEEFLKRYSKAPLDFEITDEENFYHNRMRRPYKELQVFFKQVRLLVFFPEGKGTFESRATPEDLEIGRISFSKFYPIDFRPIPKIDKGLDNFRDLSLSTALSGCHLCVPSDLEKLSQIRAKFVMADEQPEE